MRERLVDASFVGSMRALAARALQTVVENSDQRGNFYEEPFYFGRYAGRYSRPYGMDAVLGDGTFSAEFDLSLVPRA